MAVMINTLGRRSQAQSDASAQAQQGEGELIVKEKVVYTILQVIKCNNEVII